MKRKISLLPFALIAIIIISLNWYVLSGLLTLDAWPCIPYIFWTVIAGLLAALFYAVGRMRRHGTDLFFKIISHIVLILFAAELIHGDHAVLRRRIPPVCR